MRANEQERERERERDMYETQKAYVQRQNERRITEDEWLREREIERERERERETCMHACRYL